MPANTSSEEQKTTPKQDLFIQALLAGNSIVTAASTAKCNEKTAHQWLKQSHVQKAYRDAQRQVFNDALGQLMLDVGEARDTLKEVMKDSSAPHSARVRAAQILLEQSIKVHEISELEEKIVELEQLVKERNP